MELASLLSQNTLEKKYVHYTTKSNSKKEAQDNAKMEFLYVGKSASKIDYLVKTFEGGYAAENADHAIAILKRIAERKSIPDLFIVDGSSGKACLNKLHNYTSSDARFAFVPFVVEASGIPESALHQFRLAGFIDEIVVLEEGNNKKLAAKVEFLKKIKKHPYRKLVDGNIQTSVNAVIKPENLLKRMFDLFVSVFAIILLSPIFLLIAAFIRLESRGPVFYISQRAGRGYKIFRFFKFRTMVVDADRKISELSHLNQYNDQPENSAVFFKVTNDPRITKVGAFLRNTSLDELPQLFNVLLGDMSLVGNRPLPLYEAATLTTDEYAARFMAPAGITGLWQIKKRGKDEMSTEERINLDIAYARKKSFFYDLWIMANTPSALIQKTNA